jgi:hypothetical protein
MPDNTGSKLMAGFIQRDKLKAAEALKTARVVVLKQSDLQKCPHFILVASHYRDDGTCKCNDKNETVMRQWGYRWKKGQWR